MAPLSYGLALGSAFVWNQPATRSPGVQAAFEVAPSPYFSFEAQLGWHAPPRGAVVAPAWADEDSVPLGRGAVVVRATPIWTEGDRHARLGVHAGMGWVRTLDDTVQRHPTLVVGGVMDVRGTGKLGVRIRLDSIRYVEVHDATELRSTADNLLGADLLIRW